MDEYISVWMRLARTIRRPVNIAAVSIIGLYETLWGLWVISPWWATYDSSSAWSAAAGLYPEWVPGLIGLVIGITIVWSVLYHKYRILERANFVGAVFWFVIMLSFFAGAWQSVAWITAMTVCFYSAFIYLNMRMNEDYLHLNKKKDTI